MARPNAHKGDVTLKIAGKRNVLRYDWEAIGKLKSELGSEFDREIARAAMEIDLPVIAKALAIGLERHHSGELTEKKIVKISPAVSPTTEAVNRAISFAFHGTEEPPELENENPTLPEKILNLIKIFSGKPKKARTVTA